MKVEVIKPYGFCHGVINAIDFVKKIRQENPTKKITILGMIVHNDLVMKDLESFNIASLSCDTKSLSELLKEINEGIVIFTAHGHDKKLENQAIEQGLEFYDATCKYVEYTKNKIIDALKDNYEVIYIGKENHLESTSILSISSNIHLYDINKELLTKPTTSKIKVFNQTTLSLFDIKAIHEQLLTEYSNIIIEDEICTATKIRQIALLNITETYDLVIIVGDKHSSNTNSLYKIAKDKFSSSMVIQVNSLEELSILNLKQYNSCLIASGTSTPNSLVEEIINYLR